MMARAKQHSRLRRELSYGALSGLNKHARRTANQAPKGRKRRAWGNAPRTTEGKVCPMTDITAQVRQLLAEAERLPISSSKLDLLQEAAALADAHQRVDLGIEVRKPLMYVARNLIRGDILTVAFTWCLAQYDRDPQQFGGRDLFWEYEMVIGQLANLPDVSRAKLEELLDDFGRRLQAAGRSLGPVQVTRRSIAPDLGDRALARAAQEAIRQLRAQGKHDFHTDRFAEMEAELFIGDEERALQLAQPMLAGRFTQDRMGAETAYAGLLLPLLKRQRLVEAKHLVQRCLHAYRPEHYYYWWFGDLLKWLTLTNRLGRAVRTYEECQRAMKAFTDPLTRLHFALDALVLFDRLLLDERQTLSLRLPEDFPVPAMDGHYRIEELQAWLLREADELAERFDRRNGTPYFQEQLQERRELQRWAIRDARPQGE